MILIQYHFSEAGAIAMTEQSINNAVAGWETKASDLGLNERYKAIR